MYDYLIIGNGRVAKHFAYYFSLCQISYKIHTRQDSKQSLAKFLETTEHILVLINDTQIDSFIQEHLLAWVGKKTIIHFSGALVSKYAFSAHPLMTFSNELYDLRTYKNIPFICEKNVKTFDELLPKLNNPYFFIKAEQKNYYHSLCVVANNFTTILWQAVNARMSKDLQIDFKYLLPILEQTFKNINTNVDEALTGPLVRNDLVTITKNLNALESDPLYDLYQAFVKYYRKTTSKE